MLRFEFEIKSGGGTYTTLRILTASHVFMKYGYAQVSVLTFLLAIGCFNLYNAILYIIKVIVRTKDDLIKYYNHKLKNDNIPHVLAAILLFVNVCFIFVQNIIF